MCIFEVYVRNNVCLPESSAIFLKKGGSGTHSDPKFSWRQGLVIPIPGKVGSGTLFQVASF
jgi:hypothetical protein